VGREIKVAAEVAGRVARVFVQEGDHVEAGAVLLSLCNSVEKAALEVTDAQLKAARVELLRTVRGMRKEDVDAVVADTAAGRVRVENSQDSVERVRKLARTGAATPDELDRSEKQAELDRRLLDVAEARRKAALAGGRTEDNWIAQARFAEAEARREQANDVLERLTVRAPIASEILQVKYRVGEYYSPGGMDPLIILGNTSSLRVRMDVDERDIAKVALGSKSFVISNAFLGRRFPGKVVEIGKRMGRKNVRSDDPTERIDTKILEIVIELSDKSGLVSGQRVMSYVEASKL
jgi:multidrug resistance efflux pump